LNVSNPDTPVLLGTFVSGYELSSVQVSGDYAFADNSVIDVSNPVSPTFLTQLPISFSIKDMVFSGRTAYALSNRG